MTVSVLWHLLMVPWIGLRFVIVVFPDHTHVLFRVELSTWDYNRMFYVQDLLSNISSLYMYHGIDMERGA